MLQKADFEDDVQEQDRSYLLRPAFYWELVQRRWLYFLAPFVVIASAGIVTSNLLPAVFLSEGKILVEAQQIPTDLVRPTVTSAAQERIQVIEQRTMTRDNLIAIADKFDLFPEKRRFMSVSELVELMKKNAKITPVDTQLDFKQTTRNPTIVFSVGFEYSDGQTAAKVANELMTRILNEDLRDRTSRATDTTKFLAREVEKLQTDRDALDIRITQAKLMQLKAAQDKANSKPEQMPTMLSQLKVELAQKSAFYSEKHPILQSLKRQIESLEREASSAPKITPPAVTDDSTVLEALKAQQETLQKNLDVAQTKLAAARLGESLERSQQSEKFEIIEQPTIPQLPVRPNRPKIAGLAVMLAAAAGTGLAFVLELADGSIRRSGDIFGIIDRQLVVSIPYITTLAELRRRRRRIVFLTVVLVTIVIIAAIAAFWLLPLDLMISKMRVGLFK